MGDFSLKLMIASDIHGSAYYCTKLLQRWEVEQSQRLVLLGDLLYHGPRNDLPKDYNPKEVIALLNHVKEHLFCVRGNCDCEVDQMVLQFPILAEYALLAVDGLTIFATHGHTFHQDNLPPLQPGDILLHGHTHIQAMEPFQEYHYLNPGSVSIPKNGNQHSYMIYENRTFFLKNLEGEVLGEYSIP